MRPSSSMWADLGSEYDMILVMKQVSIQELKAGLSAAVAEAQAGRTIVIKAQ